MGADGGDTCLAVASGNKVFGDTFGAQPGYQATKFKHHPGICDPVFQFNLINSIPLINRFTMGAVLSSWTIFAQEI